MALTSRAAWLCIVSAVAVLPSAAHARSSQWWYVAQASDRVLFVDEKSIERDGDMVRHTSRQVLREDGSEVGTQRAFMRSDCAKRTQQWVLAMRYGRDEQPLPSYAAADGELENVQEGTLGEAELDFVCARDRSTTGGFPIAIDDVAFAEALIANEDPTVSPSDIYAELHADPATPVIRSSAPSPRTFGTDQQVMVGKPIVPPRDYSVGVEPPDSQTYDADESGRIYDIAYTGIEKGQLVFEVRGYAISDLVHSDSGQMVRFPVRTKEAQIRDLLFTILDATPDSLRYRVIHKKADDAGFPGANE